MRFDIYIKCRLKTLRKNKQKEQKLATVAHRHTKSFPFLLISLHFHQQNCSQFANTTCKNKNKNRTRNNKLGLKRYGLWIEDVRSIISIKITAYENPS